jgi:hypothetical protein
VTRLSITLLHTFIAISTTMGAVFVFLQGLINQTWEYGFYGSTSPLTQSLLLTGILLIALGITHTISALGYFTGSVRSGWLLLIITWLLIGTYPWPLAILLGLTGLLILLDIMVVQHRATHPSESDT